MSSPYASIGILLFIVCGATSQTIGDRCVTSKYRGTCEVIFKCSYALTLLVSDKKNELISISCGFRGVEPMVCCPPDSNDLAASNRVEITTRSIRSTTIRTNIRNTFSADDAIVFKDPKLEKPMYVPETTRRNTTSQFNERDDLLPNRSICGQHKAGDKIFGGSIADLDEFPWIARIQRKDRSGKGVFGCAGSLITNRYVLTAAHCFGTYSPQYDTASVRLGEWNIQTDKDCHENECSDDPVDIPIEEVIMYPGYSREDVTNGDIALLRLARPVVFTDFIQPVCLPTTEYAKNQDYTLDGSYEAAGWGMTELEQESVIKRKVTLNAVSMDICRLVFTRIPESSISRLICAGGMEGKDSCRGDSGGPLVKLVKENNGMNYFLYGVTSFGSKNCGTEGIPGVYTRVSSFMPWINQVIQNNNVKERFQTG